MSKENMDRLFRERAEQYEAKPSAAAWEQISGTITTEKRVFPMVWKVAAMLTVLLSATLILFNLRDNTTSDAYVIADHPVQTLEPMQWNLPEQKVITEDQMAPAQYANAQQTPFTIDKSLVQEKEVWTEVAATGRPILDIKRLDVVLEFPALPHPVLSLNKPKNTGVKIRYYASNTSLEEEKEKKSLGQFLAKAQAKLSPDVLLADIRTAKDDLFRGNKGD